MSLWQQRERARITLSKETGYVLKPHGARLRVALAFPNTYWVGMSNLGFQTVYRLFNDLDDVVWNVYSCRPPGARRAGGEQDAARDARIAVDGQRVRRHCLHHVVRWDYVSVLTLLRLAGVPCTPLTAPRGIRWSSSAAP